MKNLKGNLILLLTALIWGLAFVAQANAMEIIEPFTYNSIRMLLGGVVLLPVILLISKKNKAVVSEEASQSTDAEKKSFKINFTLWSGGIICGVILGIASSLQQIGISKGTTAGKAGFITALYIVIVPLLQLFAKKKLPKKIYASIIIALAGLFFLCFTDFNELKPIIGDLYILVCALVFAFHILAVDRFSPIADGVKLSCIQFFTAGILNFIAMFIFEKPVIKNILTAAPEILYAGILSCGVAYTLQIIGQKHTTPVFASIIMSFESVFAALGAWIIIGQTMLPAQIGGAVLMMGAFIWAQLPDNILKKKSK